MSIDLMGSRFYMQQMSASRGGTKTPARLKKDIRKDIENKMGLVMPSLMKMTKPDMEAFYDALSLQER